MAAVDLFDDFQMARQQSAEEADGPLFKSFGHQRVIGVGERLRGDAPGRVPVHGVLVDEQAHQFGDRDGRMGVVHLDGEGAMQVGERAVLRLLDLDDVLQRAGDEEELLFQTQLLALNLLVVGVENLGDVLGVDLVADGAEEVAGVEGFEVEGLDGLRGPKAHGVGGVGAVAEDGRVVGNAADQLLPESSGRGSRPCRRCSARCGRRI